MDRADWNKRHADNERRSSGDANRRLVAEMAGLRPGRALDLACGQGRHSVWLAEHAWRVTGVDFSTVGLEKARNLAAARGVSVEWVNADLLRYRPAGRSFDLMLISYLHMPPDDRRSLLGTAVRALAPGGTFLLLGHDRRNREHGYGGPDDAALLYDAQEIVAELKGLDIERTELIERPVETPAGDRVALDLLLRATRPP